MNSKICSSSSLNSDASHSLSKPIEICESSSNPMLSASKESGSSNTSESGSISGSCSSTQQLEQFFSPNSTLSSPASKPVSIKSSKRFSLEMMLSTSAPSSASSSPILSSSGRPAFFKHRKTSSTSSGNFNMFMGEYHGCERRRSSA